MLTKPVTTSTLLAACLALSILATARPADATTVSVDCLANPNTALQSALSSASDGDTLTITGGCVGQFVVPGTFVTGLTLLGADPSAALDGGNAGTTLTVQSGAKATVSHLTITGGTSSGLVSAGSLTVTHALVTGNSGADGQGGSDGTAGGIVSTGALTVVNSTITANTGGAGGVGANSIVDSLGGGGGDGGAGAIESSGTLAMKASTVSSNSGGAGGIGGMGMVGLGPSGASGVGGIHATGGSLASTIVAQNNPGGVSDCQGPLISLDYNIIGSVTGCGFNVSGTDIAGSSVTPVDPGLLPLADNGGNTETMALQGSSPAVDHVGSLDPGCPADDQRGAPRPQRSDCDTGAYELGAPDTGLTIHAPRRVRDGSIARVTGSLTSLDAGCPDSQTISLLRGSKVLGTDTTDATGAYLIKTRVTRRITVHTSFAGVQQCGASISDDRTISLKR